MARAWYYVTLSPTDCVMTLQYRVLIGHLIHDVTLSQSLACAVYKLASKLKLTAVIPAFHYQNNSISM